MKNSVFLFYSNNCLQCDYVIKKLEKYNVLYKINLIDIEDPLNDDKIEKYNVTKAPTAVILKNDKVIKRVLNLDYDITWLYVHYLMKD